MKLKKKQIQSVNKDVSDQIDLILQSMQQNNYAARKEALNHIIASTLAHTLIQVNIALHASKSEPTSQDIIDAVTEIRRYVDSQIKD